ncbi:hypothetical protein Dimus_017056 [Dionaea muscipula]
MDSKSSGSAASNSAPTPTPPAPPPPPPPPAPTFSDDLSSDLSSYRAAVQFDRDLRVFDRTSRAINFLASSSSSVGTLGEVTRNSAPTSTPSVPQTSPHVSSSDLSPYSKTAAQFDMEVVRVILECKKGIWDNKDLLSLVNKYFECSIQTRVFFDTLGRCLKRASDLQLILQALPLQFEEENGNLDAGGGDHMLMNGKYETLQELIRDFKETPFGDEFFKLLDSVYGPQVQMTEKLNVKHHQLQKKLKGIQVYRKLCGTGFNKLWGKYEDDDLKGERDLLQTMRISPFISLKGLDSIRVLAHRLEMKLDRNLVDLLELAWGPVIEEIKMVGRLREEIKELMLHATIYSQDARKARSIIIHKIITYPSISN